MFKLISPILRLLRARLAPPVEKRRPLLDDASPRRISSPSGAYIVPFTEPVRLEIEDVFDLHTVQPCEVRVAIEEYLREARTKGFRTVRIIHGKGRGALRAQVHAILARTPFALGWTDAPPEAGGWGATIVQLSPIDEEVDLQGTRRSDSNQRAD